MEFSAPQFSLHGNCNLTRGFLNRLLGALYAGDHSQLLCSVEAIRVLSLGPTLIMCMPWCQGQVVVRGPGHPTQAAFYHLTTDLP